MKNKLKIENGEYAGVLAWLSDAKGYCETAISNGYEMVKEMWETGDIRQTTWESFCMCCLDELMEDNKKILHRLKN